MTPRARLLSTFFAFLTFFVFAKTLFLFNNASSSASSTDILNKTSVTKARVVPKTKAFHCKSKKSYDGHMRSQSMEDKELLYEFGFDQICGGTYLEMGGLNGVHYSNSYVFHKALDWKGVLVEASSTNYAKMNQNRPNEIANVNAGICGQEKDLHWVNIEHNGAINGFVEFAPKSFQEKWWTEQNIQDAKVVKCRTLKNVLKEAVGDHFHFDFYSLDIEGAEYDALMSIDFDLVSFGVIFVESDEHNKLKNLAVRMLLSSAGYTFIKERNRSFWFVNNEFGRIYEDLIH